MIILLFLIKNDTSLHYFKALNLSQKLIVEEISVNLCIELFSESQKINYDFDHHYLPSSSNGF